MADLTIAMERVGAISQTTVRADLSKTGQSIAEALGLPVPSPLGVAWKEARRVVWMSPDELLVIAAKGAGAGAALRTALDGTHHMVLDVSDARGVVRLTGRRVGEVLAKGAPCDLSDRGFPPGTARRTHVGGLAVAIWRLDDQTWEIACFSSFLHHLHAWLADAAQPGSEVA